MSAPLPAAGATESVLLSEERRSSAKWEHWERWSLYGLTVLVTVTGVIYGYLRYFGQVNGEFGPEPHPWQPLLQHSHVMVAPAMVLILGMALRSHAVVMLRKQIQRRRGTGLFLLAVIVPMVFGGYGLQVVTSPIWRLVLAWVHGISSLLFCAGFALHLRKKYLAGWSERLGGLLSSPPEAGPANVSTLKSARG